MSSAQRLRLQYHCLESLTNMTNSGCSFISGTRGQTRTGLSVAEELCYGYIALSGSSIYELLLNHRPSWQSRRHKSLNRKKHHEAFRKNLLLHTPSRWGDVQKLLQYSPPWNTHNSHRERQAVSRPRQHTKAHSSAVIATVFRRRAAPRPTAANSRTCAIIFSCDTYKLYGIIHHRAQTLRHDFGAKPWDATERCVSARDLAGATA